MSGSVRKRRIGLVKEGDSGGYGVCTSINELIPRPTSNDESIRHVGPRNRIATLKSLHKAVYLEEAEM